MRAMYYERSLGSKIRLWIGKWRGSRDEPSRSGLGSAFFGRLDIFVVRLAEKELVEGGEVRDYDSCT